MIRTRVSMRRLTVLLGQRACTTPCTGDFSNPGLYHKFMKTGLRISIKDYRRNKNLKILLFRTIFTQRQFYVRMNGQPWPRDGRPVSLTRLFAGLRKALVRSG
jgi:hypothetical protein